MVIVRHRRLLHPIRVRAARAVQPSGIRDLRARVKREQRQHRIDPIGLGLRYLSLDLVDVVRARVGREVVDRRAIDPKPAVLVQRDHHRLDPPRLHRPELGRVRRRRPRPVGDPIAVRAARVLRPLTINTTQIHGLTAAIHKMTGIDKHAVQPRGRRRRRHDTRLRTRLRPRPSRVRSRHDRIHRVPHIRRLQRITRRRRPTQYSHNSRHTPLPLIRIRARRTRPRPIRRRQRITLLRRPRHHRRRRIRRHRRRHHRLRLPRIRRPRPTRIRSRHHRPHRIPHIRRLQRITRRRRTTNTRTTPRHTPLPLIRIRTRRTRPRPIRRRQRITLLRRPRHHRRRRIRRNRRRHHRPRLPRIRRPRTTRIRSRHHRPHRIPHIRDWGVYVDAVAPPIFEQLDKHRCH